MRVLHKSTEATTLSPWGMGGTVRLRPSVRRALILIDFKVPAEHAVTRTVQLLDRILRRRVRTPVTATQTGFATLSKAIQDESVRSTRIAELVAIPFLLIVLLFVFRSPLAAAIPLCFGAATVIAARGILSLAAAHIAIDGFALTVCSMMGLALGVDYALLMVARFREELAAGATPFDAASRARETAGRTTAFAGSTLILAMAMTLWVMPGNLFLSLAGAAILVTLISVAVAVLAAPPLLMLLAHNLDRWRLPAGGVSVRLMAVVGSALRRPRLAAGLIGGALLLLAAPALALRTGAPDVTQLPASNSARRDAEVVDRAVGEGWDAPFVMVAAARSGPITSGRRLAALSRAQREIAADPAVQAVIGPRQVARRVAPLKRGGEDLLAGRGRRAPRGSAVSATGSIVPPEASDGSAAALSGRPPARDRLPVARCAPSVGQPRSPAGSSGPLLVQAAPPKHWIVSIGARAGWPRPSATPRLARALCATN